VKETSPALKLGFKNFPMDQFGVQKPELKKIAKTPALPGTQAAPVSQTSRPAPSKSRAAGCWLQATAKALEGEEFSAFGVARDAGGLQLVTVPEGSAAAKAGLQKDDLVMSVNGKALKQVGDLAKVMNDAGGKPLEVAFVRNQQPQKLNVEAYPYVVAETTADGNFKNVPLAPAGEVLKFAGISTSPTHSNEPLGTLQDGKLAENYGPVIGNGAHAGLYRIDLGKAVAIREFNVWSYGEGARGPQHFTLYGSTSEADPGWNVEDAKVFTPIGEVNTKDVPAGKFNATSLRQSKGGSLGSYRWLVCAAYPLNATGEHTVFQEVQVRGE
jgi:membrane-associated protease RseP (regulator of RpoE activity)